MTKEFETLRLELIQMVINSLPDDDLRNIIYACSKRLADIQYNLETDVILNNKNAFGSTDFHKSKNGAEIL